MSSIDNRVVKMQFDAAQFLSGAKSTIEMLAKLKSALDMGNAAKSLDSISTSASKVNLEPLLDSVEKTQSKFSILAQAASVALGNIASKAIETGAQFLSAFTTAPVLDGFNEYELKMNSIQTMLMSTGEPLEKVNQKLEELNTYSDKTIYSFADMTQNIGKFTNAGISLDESVAAIQGVANVAALSGANANEASHAMYNFGQALSSGAVKLIDWKSIENANMATVEFKNELIKTAVEMGTLTKQEGKYVSTTTDLNGKVSEAFDATSMFNDSLSHQWMTSEVLTKTLGRYADETTEIGKKAYKAASQIKTFSQLIDTTKESIGSGWAQSFEIIFGDFNEALNLWTKIGGVIDNFVQKQSNARNDMLQTWKDLGGREDLIKGLSNVLSGLADIIKAISSAWEDVFPPMTGQRLADITEKFAQFTSKMRLSEEASKNLHDTFEGLFSVVKTIGGIFGDFISSILPLGSGFGHIGESILSFTGTIGRFASSLMESIDETEFFRDAFNDLSRIISSGAEKIGDGLRTVIDKAKSFGESIGQKGFFKSIIDMAEEFKKEVSNSESIFSGLTDSLKKIFNPEKIADIVGGFGKGIAFIFKSVSEFITNVLNSGGLESFIHAGMLTRFLDDIKEFTSGFSSPLEALKELTEKIGSGASGVLNAVKDSLETFQSSIKSTTLLKIAGAIAILASSVIVLGTIDSGKTIQALTSVGVLLAELFGSLLIFEKISGDKSYDNIEKMGTSLILLSGAILILSGAVKTFSTMDMNSIARGLITVAGLAATLIIATNKMDTASKKMIRSSIGLVIFAEAIKELGVAVAGLGSLDVETLAKGLISVASLMTGLAAFTNLTDTSKIGIFKGAAFIEIAQSIKMLSDVATTLASIDTESLIAGLASVGILLMELSIFTTTTGNANHVLSTAVAMGVLSLAMMEMSQVVSTFSSLSWEEIARGLTGIAGSLLVMGVAVAAMPKGLPQLAVSVGLMGVALSALSVALGEFGGMQWDEIGRGLVAMAGSLTVVGIAVQFMQTALPGAAALLVISAAMAIFGPVMGELGKLSLKEIGTALLALAGAFAVIGVAGLLLTPVIPAILSFAAALGALAAVIAVAAISIAAIISSNAFASLAGAFTSVGDAISNVSNEISAAAIVETIKGILEAIITLIPDLATSLLSALSVFLQGIITFAPLLGEALTTVLMTVIQVITTCIPAVVEAASQLVLAIVNAITTYGPQIISAFTSLVVMLVQALADAAPALIGAGMQLIIGLMNGLANAIRDNQEALFAAVRNMMEALIELILSALQELVSLIPGVGPSLSKALESAKETVRETLAPESMSDIGKNAVTGLTKGIDGESGTAKKSGQDLGKSTKESILSGLGDTLQDGSNAGMNFAGGLSSMIGMASTSGTDLATGAIVGLLSNASQFGDAGVSDGMDFSSMLGSMSGEANSAGMDVSMNALDGLMSNTSQFGDAGNQNGSSYVGELNNYAGEAQAAGDNLSANASSGAYNHVGEFNNAGNDAGSGFVNGILGWAANAASAAANMVSNALEAARSAMDSNSPSKKFRQLGRWADEGLILGFQDLDDEVSQASENVVTNSLDAITDTMNSAISKIDENSDFNPKITPVVDLSNVSKGADQISSMFNADTSIRMAADIEQNQTKIDNMDELVKEISDRIDLQNDRIANGIDSLKQYIAQMASSMVGLQVVMDNGVLVGQIAGAMDDALGIRQEYAERGI